MIDSNHITSVTREFGIPAIVDARDATSPWSPSFATEGCTTFRDIILQKLGVKVTIKGEI
ncbi:MAG TPA: hypothetical protein VJW95_07475 [Dissulfurispiraceae bacterium]|nr:hypothetical protein [Dissulfurispiraceae bacterium]